MPDASAWNELPSDDAALLEHLCREFEDGWKQGVPHPIEKYLNRVSDRLRACLLRELLLVELEYRRRKGEQPAASSYRQRFPQHAELIRAVFDETAAAPHAYDDALPSDQSADDELPAQFGRYQVQGKLGRGGFGTVYKAYDADLRRTVAVKVPNKRRVLQPGYAEAYIKEAQRLAALHHPDIVPVHNVGRTAEEMPFVVYGFIEGGDLKGLIRKGRLPYRASAELVAVVARALHYVHLKRLVHRDIKPSNILLDAAGKPYLADFGIALPDEEFGKGPELVGTTQYMSPEQARHESHRVDGRSDIFSVGVVFYELLTGRTPFQGATQAELEDQITSVDPRPLRMIDDRVPKELERICLKALTKKAADRYATALDLAEDLNHFIEAHPRERTAPAMVVPDIADRPAREPITPTPTPTPEPFLIVPRGLRSFDESDADFFLELLPGPRDRDGLPERIRFWKRLIDQRDGDQTFSVGLIYGPSGCGKSSLVKAGLLPRLAAHVLPIYVEASAEGTEADILKSLRKHCPGLPAKGGLVEVMNALRRGRGAPVERKVLIVLDQFEQWLHARQGQYGGELIQALRQCDGEHVQCLVMVRDDFWMATTQFMHELEIPILEGKNSAAVELFTVEHARRVLARFGEAYGVLPADREPTRDQAEFLDRAAVGLAQEGKVICVRLALFAEMMKARPWTPASLKSAGGTEGVGVTFLEETFSATTAPIEHRYHQRAARAVLKALLPDAGSQIKGHMRSLPDLLEASGYANRPTDFAELIRILDNELRLITPTDVEQDGHSQETSRSRQRYYQLTHDYLVPSLSAWLTRKQKETRRGRAELRLAEQAALWNAKQTNRLLPSLWEWGSVDLLTHRRDWTSSQRRMMKRATRYHLRRLGLLSLLLVLVGWGVFETVGFVQASSLIETLWSAKTAEVPRIVAELSPYRRWADRQLRQLLANTDKSSAEHQKLALALLPVDASQLEGLFPKMLDANPDEMKLLRDSLQAYRTELVPRLWHVLSGGQVEPGRRLRAACALAAYDHDNLGWRDAAREVSAQLLRENPLLLADWLELLKPAADHLTPPLTEVFDGVGRPESERVMAASLLAEYAADQPQRLAECLLAAEPAQYALIFPKLARHGGQAIAQLELELETLKKKLTARWPDQPRPSHWIDPEPSLVEQVVQADGLVHDHFAFCHSMSLGKAISLMENLRPAGYRPTCFRPYRVGDDMRAAILWTRDQRPWRIDCGISAEDAQLHDRARQKDRYSPVDVSCYSVPLTEAGHGLRYAVIWSKLDASFVDARLLVEKSNTNEYPATCRRLYDDGFVPRTLTAFEDHQQTWFSSVWWKPAARHGQSHLPHGRE